jgi:hypothetical protein
MVVNDELRYFGKIVKNRNRSVITNNGTIAFFKHRDDSSLFPQRRESDTNNNNNNNNDNNNNITAIPR